MVIKKKYLRLREDAEKNYAADISGKNSSLQDTVNKTRSEHPDAQKVTVPANEIDGNTSTQTSTLTVKNTPDELNKARKMVQKLGPDASDTQVEVVTEGITFTKKELREWLRSF